MRDERPPTRWTQLSLVPPPLMTCEITAHVDGPADHVTIAWRVRETTSAVWIGCEVLSPITVPAALTALPRVASVALGHVLEVTGPF